MRHAATKALLERNDVIIVASVSCIYGLGSPESYFDMLVVARAAATRSSATRSCASSSTCSTSATTTTSTAARSACAATSSRSIPAYEEARAIRVELFGDTVESICEIDPLRGKVLRKRRAASRSTRRATTSRPRRRSRRPSTASATELKERLDVLRDEPASSSRRSGSSSARCYDLELLAEMGFCPGIENYSRHLDGRAAGRAAVHAARLLPGRLPAGHRREPRHRPADRRHVPRRPLAQGDAGRVRLPPAVGARQPAAQLRGVPAAHAAGALRLGDARASTSSSRRRGVVVEQLIRPTGLIDPGDRSSGRRATRWTTCSSEIRDARRAPASACW